VSKSHAARIPTQGQSVLGSVFDGSPFDWSAWCWLGLILAVGSFAQGAVGFAAGLFVVPILVASHWTLAEAQAILLLATLVQNVWGSYSLRSHIPPRTLWLPALLRIAWMPAGVALQWLLHGFGPTVVRQSVGAAVLLVTTAVIVVRPTPRPQLHPFWTYFACSLSGIFQGLCCMGGPALVLWVQAHDWTSQRSRGFLFTQYLLSLFPTLLLLAAVFGNEVWRAVAFASLHLPIILAATYAGIRAGDRLSTDRLRTITLLLLLLLGISQVIGPWIQR
jgi:uncharacterized protein